MVLRDGEYIFYPVAGGLRSFGAILCVAFVLSLKL